jgi:hypothetical protein
MASDTIRPGIRLEEGDLIYGSGSRPKGLDRFTLLLAFCFTLSLYHLTYKGLD